MLRADHKNMHADPDFHYSLIDSTTEKILSVINRLRSYKLIPAFTLHQ